MSAYNATLVEKLLAAGMIVLGKTHTVEFAYGAWGTNQHMGTPWNPWDPDIHRTPGGSSSGSAVAVAARMAPCAIGTDTGGSVHSRRLVRHYRIEDQHRAHQHPWRDPAQSDSRHAGTDYPQRGRLRHPVGAFARKRSR